MPPVPFGSLSLPSSRSLPCEIRERKEANARKDEVRVAGGTSVRASNCLSGNADWKHTLLAFADMIAHCVIFLAVGFVLRKVPRLLLIGRTRLLRQMIHFRLEGHIQSKWCRYATLPKGEQLRREQTRGLSRYRRTWYLSTSDLAERSPG
jgi:hypothetical protein